MNTTATTSWREKFLKNTLQKGLRNSLIAEKICQVDRSDSYYIQNPYLTAVTATVQTIVGSYGVSATTTTNDTLTVTDEFTYAVHVYDFERRFVDFDLMAEMADELTYAVTWAIDKFVVNSLLTDGTGAYTTPAGGFTSATNIPEIFANLLSKVAGYAESYKGTYLVVENTDVPGILQASANSGFNFADATLNNGWVGNYMGVDIYVIRSGTFVTDTLGSKSVVCSGHRLFGVKGICTYASPRGVVYEEKMVTAKTGREILLYGYCGVKVWTQSAGLTVDITLA